MFICKEKSLKMFVIFWNDDCNKYRDISVQYNPDKRIKG